MIDRLCEVVCTALPEQYDDDTVLDGLSDAEIIISGWGMPRLTTDRLDQADHLKLIIYGASSVKYFLTDEVFDRGITVTSAASANGTVVAEFTIAMMTLSLKGAWPMIRREVDLPGYFDRAYPWLGNGGIYDATIGIVGASSVGREVLRLLRSYRCSVLLYDPFVDEEEANRLGARQTDLDTLMESADLVSLHAPNIANLKHMIGRRELSRMKNGAWFINTARGALVDEPALIDELVTGRINACIDVTDPEPPGRDNPMLSLPNVVVTPHMAGAIGADVRRMGVLCMFELIRYLRKLPPINPVVKERLPYIN